MKILSGPASVDLGKTIASKLDLPLLPIDYKQFYDGESYLRITESVKDEEIIVVQSTNPPQEKHLIELILLSSTLQEMGAEKIIAIIPYLCYARADRSKIEGEIVSHKVILDLIYHSGINSILTLNVHNKEVYEKLNQDLEKYNLNVIPLLVEYLRELPSKNWFIVGPDEGIKDNVIDVAKGLNVSYAFMKKNRDPYTHQIELEDTGFECENKDVLLIDDVITSGGTAIKAAELIIKKKPASLTFFSIHALSKSEVFEKLKAVGVTEIISTNTIPRTDISQIDVSSLISNFIEEKFL